MVSSILGTRGAQHSPLGRPLPLAVAPMGKRSPGCFKAVSRVHLFAYLKGTRCFLSSVAIVSTPSPGCHGRGQIPLLRLLQVSHCFSFIEIYLIDIHGRKQTCKGPFHAPSDPPYSGGGGQIWKFAITSVCAIHFPTSGGVDAFGLKPTFTTQPGASTLYFYPLLFCH